MDRNYKYMQISPSIPSGLDVTSSGIWISWTKMSDKEIMRETAMKGVTFDLASQFLSKRNNWILTDSIRWLETQITAWALDLINRGQIHKAMHIYQINNRNGFDEIRKVLMETKDDSLRGKLKEVLIKNKKWNDEDERCWMLFGCVKNENDEFSFGDVFNKSENWKIENGTKMFFKTFDIGLESFVDKKIAWNVLLKENLKLIKCWINIQFGNDFNCDNIEKLKPIFIKMKITQEMIDSVLNFDVSEIVLDELCKFGVFETSETNDLEKFIKRIIKNFNNLKNFLQNPAFLNNFTKLFIDYSLKNKLIPVLNYSLTLIKPEIIELNPFYDYLKCILTANDLIRFQTPENYSKNLVETSQFLSQNDLLFRYFDNNPIILLAILIFQKIPIHDLYLEKSIKTICGVNPLEILDTFDILIIEHDKLKGALISKPLKYLDLIEKHTNIKTQYLYKHRFIKNENFPNFDNENLLKSGYQKEIGVIFFVKQLRPCYAYKKFIQNKTQNYILTCDKIERLAIKNILNAELVISCINFIEILNGKSFALRIYLNTAEIINKSKLIDQKEINRLFNDVDMNSDEIFNILQSALFKTLKTKNNENLTTILTRFDILIKFANLHTIRPPNVLIKYFAEQNQWLEFLIFIEIYNYPLEIVLKSLENFKNPSIQEHFEHCFKNDVQKHDEGIERERKERNPKKYFFSTKSGLTTSSEKYATSDLSSLSSYGSMTSNSIESDILESETLSFKTELLMVFIKCHNSVDPPKAFQFACRYYRRPLLAVFAMCYEPDSIIINWLTWLEVSCNVDITHFNSETIIESDFVLNSFRTVLSEGYFKTLWQSYYIFLNENPLRHFLEFINDCLQFKYQEDSFEKTLKLFSKKLIKTRRNSFVSEIGSDIHFINNKVWIQTTAIYLIGLTLQYGFKNLFDKILFMRFLSEIEITQYFSIPIPNFKTILKILEYFFDNNYDLNFDLSVINNPKRFKKELEDFIFDLLEKKEYRLALNLAEFSDFPTENLIFEQVQGAFRAKKDYYWLEIEEIFKKGSYPPFKAVNYFKEISEEVVGFEKYAILKIALNWCENFNLIEKTLIEKLAWISFFKMENCIDHLSLPADEEIIFYYNENKLNDENTLNWVFNEIEMDNLMKTIETLLELGDLNRALKIGSIFGFSTSNLDILKLSLMLAEGIVLVDHLTFEQRLLLIKKGSGHLKRTGSNLFEHQKILFVDETLSTLEILGDNLTKGTQIAIKIFKTYRIGLFLKKNYKEIAFCKEPLTTLKEALSSENVNYKLEVINDFINVFKITKQEIADLICSELIDSITTYSKSVLDVYFLWDVNIQINFTQILQLLTGNCTILGTKLFNIANTIHQNENQIEKLISNETLTLITELLIKSHDCFTADCNMEGISMVLKQSQALISTLIIAKNWNLIIRLLVGIKRYSEMNYIFPILKENGQFELLLRKGSRKDVGLKTALLEYLKRYCPEDVELYKIVALHFFLFSEIADLWENESQILIKRLIQIAKIDIINNKPDNTNPENLIYFSNCEDTKNILKKIIKNYHHAAQYHLNGSKVSKSMKTAQKAKLAALQLSLFNNLPQNESCICLFKLTKTQINKILLEKFNFYQTLILINAYDYKIDWAPILFEQSVVKSSPDYLNQYLSTFELSKTLLHEISRKFLSYSNPSDKMIVNMKNILNKFSSVHTKYRIASELGFSDIVERLLESNQLCYLKDTVWKSGYRNTES
ncbi:spatacsin [Onthophagus taurus]|uniref:spatacsin n=1 Tax=Onthophagus taurus TaxID=166361 RepID=UPI0039BE3BD0